MKPPLSPLGAYPMQAGMANYHVFLLCEDVEWDTGAAMALVNGPRAPGV